MIRESQDGNLVYQGCDDVCTACAFKNRCRQSDKGHARTITTDDKESLQLQNGNGLGPCDLQTAQNHRRAGIWSN